MGNKFQTGEGLQTLLFLQENLGAEVVYVSPYLVHFKLAHNNLSQNTIELTETAKENYPELFSSDDLFLLFEHPLGDNTLRFVFYGPMGWLEKELHQQFGGIVVGKYWIIDNEAKSYYGYTCDKLPEASDIIEYAESFLHN